MAAVCFKQAFVRELCPNDTEGAQSLWNEMLQAYDQPHRRYHAVAHLDQLHSELWPFHREFEDWAVILAAVAFHDFVYDPKSNMNEEESAKKAVENLPKMGFDTVRIQRCSEFILATKHHSISLCREVNLFIDADLSILGSAPARYEEYQRQIRQEYSCYPDPIYYPGRAKVLSRFLEKPAIFQSPEFQCKYEAKARVNLQHELKSLGAIKMNIH